MMMFDFEQLAEMTFLIFALDEEVVLNNGVVINRDNFSSYISLIFDA
jgi:hypothetical protein